VWKHANQLHRLAAEGVCARRTCCEYEWPILNECTISCATALVIVYCGVMSTPYSLQYMAVFAAFITVIM
jgi:hypothetical protein